MRVYRHAVVARDSLCGCRNYLRDGIFQRRRRRRGKNVHVNPRGPAIWRALRLASPRQLTIYYTYFYGGDTLIMRWIRFLCCLALFRARVCSGLVVRVMRVEVRDRQFVVI